MKYEELPLQDLRYQVFYIPRSNPDGYSVNVRYLEPAPAKLSIVPVRRQELGTSARRGPGAFEQGAIAIRAPHVSDNTGVFDASQCLSH